MLILLDENLLNKKLKQPFIMRGYSVLNVYDLGWQGLKDQEILKRAENYPVDVFITADKNLPHQQNLYQVFDSDTCSKHSYNSPDIFIASYGEN